MDSALQVKLLFGSIHDKLAYSLKSGDISWFEAFRIV